MNTRFQNPNDPDNILLMQTLKKWLIQKFSDCTESDIHITELACTDPHCVHTETLFTITKNAEKQHYKVAKPLVYIRKWDIEALKRIESQAAIAHKH